MKIVGVLSLAALLAAVLGFLYFRSSQQSIAKPAVDNDQTRNIEYTFQNPKKSAHYESNSPAHGAVLAGIPVNVVIDFNFDLAKPSEIKILKENQDFGVGETVIDENKLAMRRSIDVNVLNGLYTVSYNACWPDGSCHDGQFQFVIDRSLASEFLDQTNQKEVEIKMSEIMFNPQNIKVSQGTKVNWINDEVVEHYVNTDSHPAHTYYPAQNSQSLAQKESYSVTFDTPGIYPYHCSAHPEMTANILVE